jgi:hypothetical protein
MAWTSSDPETNQLLSALPIDLADVATSDDTPPRTQRYFHAQDKTNRDRRPTVAKTPSTPRA